MVTWVEAEMELKQTCVTKTKAQEFKIRITLTGKNVS